MLKIKNKPRRRAGSLNNTVTEFITEFSICCISLVSREITSPFFSLVKKLILKFMIFSKSEFLILVTTLTLTFAIIRDDKYLKIFARKTDIRIIKQTNLRASFLPLV